VRAIIAGVSTPTPLEQIQIGPITTQDSEPLFRWFNDPQAARLDYAWRPVDGISHQKWITSIGTDPTQIWFAIRRTGHAGIIGFVILRNISAVHRSAELGVRIGEEGDRGRGAGKEATRQVLQFCWQAQFIDGEWKNVILMGALRPRVAARGS
jgi:RimJ/RimL family protein N-acetyltransferase